MRLESLDDRPIAPADVKSIGHRRSGSSGASTSRESDDVPSSWKRTSIKAITQPGSHRQEKSPPERVRGLIHRIQIDRNRANPRNNFAKMDSIESLDLAVNFGSYSRESLARDETLDGYFDAMKLKASSSRRSEIELDRSLPKVVRDAQTVIGSRSVASGVMTVRTEPLMHQEPKRRHRKSNRKRSKSRKESSSKLSRGVYAQICFDEGRADVEYAKLRSSDKNESASRKKDTEFDDLIVSRPAKVVSRIKEGDILGASKLERRSDVLFKPFSSTAA
jgi:hypothetical protein